ncbi:MAG: hypothetical protein OJF59_002309 [Cytophagales bacterium]|nr:MAG: hypothetical protein OJF59_002309 [Cytophagales bacterium]
MHLSNLKIEKMKKAMGILLLAGTLTSCGPRIIYYGRNYTPTTNVDIFFRENDITDEHEIMGKLVYEVTARKKSEKVQNKLMNEGKRKGADAIIFDDIELTRTGSKTAGAAGGAVRSGFFFGLFGSSTKYSKGQEVKGTLVKYKKNILK